MDYQESHKILYILTDEKVMSLLVRRSKRYNSGLINIAQKLTKISFVDNEKKLSSTNEISLIDSYEKIKNNFEKMALIEYITEVLYKGSFDRFDILYQMIDKLFFEITNRDDLQLLYIQFKIKMLFFYGILPSFKECSKCGSNEQITISISNGSECIKHRSSDNIGIDATKLFYILFKDKFDIKMDLEAVKLLNDIIDKFYDKHFFTEFQSENLVSKILKI